MIPIYYFLNETAMVICPKREGKIPEERINIDEITREIPSFILNFFRGLGFYFSGTVHNLDRLRFSGVMLVAALLFLIPVSAVILHPHPLTNYHFTTADLLLPSTIALTSATFGVVV